ncbi:phosphate ABC transporter substrate-binding protein [Thalassotalea ganghwensis]
MTYFTIIATANAEIAVIVHPQNQSTFDTADIKKIFLGKAKKFANGAEATPFTLENSLPAAEQFTTKVIGKSISQLNAYWSKKIFTGKGTPPKALQSNEKVLKEVASNPNAIAYIDKSAVTSDVKVIATF